MKEFRFLCHHLRVLLTTPSQKAILPIVRLQLARPIWPHFLFQTAFPILNPAHDAGTNSETTNNANVQKVLQETSLEMIKISLVSSEASDNSNNSAEIQNLQGVCPSQDSHNLQGGESELSETLST